MPRRSRTTRKRDGEHYLLNGTKRFITNAPEAGIFTVMARTDPQRQGRARHLRVHRRARHARPVAGQDRQEDGTAAARTPATSCFEDCRVPAANLIGGREGVGLQDRDEGARPRPAAHRGGVRRRGGAACCADALALCDGAQAVRTADRGIPARAGDARRQQDRDLRGALHGARCRAPRRDDGPRRGDRGRVLRSCSPPRCAAASPTARCRSTAARATSADYAIERFYRDVRLFRIYEGTSQIQQLVIARNMIRDAAK